MFPLQTKDLPANAADLTSAMNASVQRIFSGATDAVTVRDRAYPSLAEIRIVLDGAVLRSDIPRLVMHAGDHSPALKTDELRITASELSVGPAVVNLQLGARGVQLQQARDAAGELVLMVESAKDGEVEVTAVTAEIERAIATVAKSEAAKHGVSIDQVQLSIRPRGERSLDAEVQLRAKKLFFTTNIRVGAKLDLDEELNAKLSGLTCNGEGTVGAMACGFLQPHLQKLDRREFPLMALPLGDIRLRDVRFAAGDKLTVSARFGA